ncbi:MAG TPA: hypothetical protein VK665_03220, partial [Candidatus Elarobacter sp.]|nr:hypothetical protein [Candidatus Elarobacter sp.]
HPVPGRVDGEPRDPGRRPAVHEEVLPEPLLRPDPARAEQRARMVGSAVAEPFAVLAALRSALAGLYLIR